MNFTIGQRGQVASGVDQDLPLKRAAVPSEAATSECSPVLERKEPRMIHLYCPSPNFYPLSDIITTSALSIPEVPSHISESNLHTCPICFKNFARASTLNNHKRIHTGEKPYSCEKCGKKFSEKGNLATHMRTHTGEKPYQCHYCDKKFTTQGHLTDHVRRHTNDRPFECDICGNRFMRSNTLNVHKRQHTGEKPYKCTVCFKGFSESGNLRTHMRVHTGERPYKCPVPMCDKMFKTKGHLNDHLKTKQHQEVGNYN